MGGRQNPHRGPSKAGKRQVAVHLSENEFSDLRAMAEKNCRSVSNQILWLIRQAIGAVQAPPAAPIEDTFFTSLKAVLEDHQSQTGCRITKKLIADFVKDRGLNRNEAANVRGRLEAVFLR